MSPESLRVRVKRLEQRVEILEQLPDRVSGLESQIVLLRDEMRSEFSATRARDDETRRVLTERIDSVSGSLTERMDSLSGTLNQRMDSVAAGLTERMDSLSDGLTKRMDSMFEVLSERMVSLFDENERHMRLLHEDLIQRIATMREGRS